MDLAKKFRIRRIRIHNTWLQEIMYRTVASICKYEYVIMTYVSQYSIQK